MRLKKRNVLNLFLVIFCFIYTLLVKVVDVSNIGPDGSKVGFSCINKFFYNVFSYNENIYKITEVLGYLALLIVCGYGLLGLYQLIKRKSLKLVDKDIIVLGIFYVVVIIIYVLFEKVIINYRPVILDGVLEASFPSSHTLLAIFVCGSGVLINDKIFSDFKYKKSINIGFIVLMVLIVLGRLISGVHWFSDILGGILIACTLLSLFNSIIHSKMLS